MICPQLWLNLNGSKLWWAVESLLDCRDIRKRSGWSRRTVPTDSCQISFLSIQWWIQGTLCDQRMAKVPRPKIQIHPYHHRYWFFKTQAKLWTYVFQEVDHQITQGRYDKMDNHVNVQRQRKWFMRVFFSWWCLLMYQINVNSWLVNHLEALSKKLHRGLRRDCRSREFQVSIRDLW